MMIPPFCPESYHLSRRFSIGQHRAGKIMQRGYAKKSPAAFALPGKSMFP